MVTLLWTVSLGDRGLSCLGFCTMLVVVLLLVFLRRSFNSSDVHVVEVTCETDQYWFCLLRMQGHDASVV